MNYRRLLKFPKNHSFFLFGARGIGKSTLLKEQFPRAYAIDLLDVNQEEAFAKNPLLFKEIVLGLILNFPFCRPRTMSKSIW